MWLPASIYQRIPQFWMLVGVLFISSAVYMGLNYRYSVAYLGLGLLSVVWSGCVMLLRSRGKQGSQNESPSAEQSTGHSSGQPD
jgi:hypothetical protein